MRRRWLRAAVLMGLGAVPARAEILTLHYEGLLRLYARGDRAAALEGLGRMRASDVDQEIQALQRNAKEAGRCPPCGEALDALPLRAAVMLHADKDEAERPPATGSEHARQCPGVQARRAGQIAAVLATRKDRDREFARRFFLAMAQRCQWDFCLQAAEQWAADGLERFPGDPALLVTRGAALEERATLEQPQAAADRVILFREAARSFSEALAASPASDHARVHLGRVQWRLGDDAAARASLEEALRRGTDAPLLHLAHLFLGQVHERAGRAQDAAREFARALEIHPQSQAAAIALSQVELVSGDSTQAREVLGRALALAGSRDFRDLYWDYVASNAASAEALFEILRRETRE